MFSCFNGWERPKAHVNYKCFNQMIVKGINSTYWRDYIKNHTDPNDSQSYNVNI